MNRILFQTEEVTSDRAELPVDDPRVVHVCAVLRKGDGDTVRVGMMDGPLGEAWIEVGKSSMRFACQWADIPPRPTLELLLACPRPKVLRRLWAQMAALGVARIRVINAAKVERYYFDAHVVRPEVYEPLLREGLQQAGCTWMPSVEIHRVFRPVIEDLLRPETRRVALDPIGRERLGEGPNPEVLAIGPEGGWTSFERDLLAKNEFQFANLGPRVLRSDTAVVAALSRVIG